MTTNAAATATAAAAAPTDAPSLDELLAAAEKVRRFASPWEVRLGNLTAAVKHARELDRHLGTPSPQQRTHAKLMVAVAGFEVAGQSLRHIALRLHDGARLPIPFEDARALAAELIELFTRVMREA
jgi:hypothetical protein